MGALLGVMIALRLTLLATAAFAAPAAEADADPQFLLGHGLAYAHHVVAPVVPLCKAVPKTVTVGQRCHAEPDCTTETVVVGRHITAPYVAHATTKVTTKHCVPGAPILEDVTTDV